jgi:ribosomal protein S8
MEIIRYKKILIHFLLLFAVSGLVMSQTSPSKISISVKGGSLNLGKKNELSGEWLLTTATGYLGSSPRKRDGYNITHTYDDLGVVLFENAPNKVASGKISELQVHFSMPDVNEVVPKTGFVGKLTIEKLSLNKRTSLDEIKKKLKGYSESTSYIEHSHRLAKDGLYIYFQFNKEENELLKVSIGPDKRS